MADERKASKASNSSLKIEQQSPEVSPVISQTADEVSTPEVHEAPVKSTAEVSATLATSAIATEPTPVKVTADETTPATVAAFEPTPVMDDADKPTPVVAALAAKTSVSSHGSTSRKASSASKQDKAETSILGEQVLTPALITDGSLERKPSGLKDGQFEPSSAALLGPPADPDHFDAEGNVQKLKYPKAVFFILTNEFCERFSFYGLRTLLSLYCSTVLRYSDDTSTIIYHTFVSLCNFFPILGAIIADSFLGKFYTIFYLSIVYAIGNITLTLASVDTAIPGMPARAISMLGLLLIALGTGGIKPCVSSFGGEQFVIPQQQKQLDLFFSIFYFSINSGSFLSTFITPILREDVHCFDKESCYPLAFGVPAILMIISLIVFVSGKSFYVVKNPTSNVIVDFFRVMWHALCVKRKSKEKRDHWIDYAIEKYGKKTTHDIKLVLRVLFLYIPLPIFWTLFDQQGSRWTFQATRMTGAIGPDFTIKPEQMQVVNPVLILAFVPLFEVALYPLLARCNLLTKPLQRLGFGGVLAGVAFLLSAFVEIALEPDYAVLPKPGNGQLRFYNGFDCPVTIVSELANNEDNTYVMQSLDLWEIKNWEFDGETKPYRFDVTLDASCAEPNRNLATTVLFRSGMAVSYLITYESGTKGLAVKDNMAFDDVEKTSTANPKLRIIFDFLDDSTKTLELVARKDGFTSEYALNETSVGTDYQELTISRYDVMLDGSAIIEDLLLEVGAVYSLLIEQDVDSRYRHRLNTITPPNSVHLLWLLPQYVVMTAGEVMYSVTGVAFSFTQAPASMKSVLQAAWLLTVGVGNLVVVVIAEAKIFESQVYEFLLFAVLMFLDMLLFAAMSWSYKYVDLKEEEEIAMLDSQNTGVDNKAYTSDQE